jgi:hypothetical protein
MKRIFTLLTFFISILSVCTLSVVEGYGQLTGDNYPVQAHVYVQRPGLKMPEYFSSTTMLRTDLILKDLTKTTLDVYLGWQITGLGLGVEAGTLPGFVPPNYLTLTKGSKRQLGGAELREYFQPGMLAVSGVGENVIFNGKLPEGFYTIKITAYEAGTGRQVSNTAETFFSVAYALPPVINLPLIGSEQPVTRPQSVLLQWMPRHTATGSNRITYSGKVCEVAEDEDPNIAINGSQNCFTIPAQPGTSYVLKASDLPLKVGKRYAFQVQVTDNNEQLEFQNQGYSEVSWFRFGEACKPPSGLQVNAIAAGRLNVSWNANPQATGYKLLYRSENQTEWTEQTTLGTSVSLVSLNPELDYEFKVITVCEVGNESPESETVIWEGEGEVDEELEDLIKKVLNPLGEPIVSTGPGIQSAVPGIEKATPSDPLPETFEDLIPKDPTKIPCISQLDSYENCSDNHPTVTVNPTGDEPDLDVGDLVTIYDYIVVLTQISGGNPYSGKGLAQMPFLNNVKVPVEFSNVVIKQKDPAHKGGCVTEVNGYFRVRNGLTPEQIRQEEIDLIHKVRTNTDPGSIYISRGQVITELGEELTTTGKDLCDGKPITDEAKQNLLKKHTLAKQGLEDWRGDVSLLYSGLPIESQMLGPIDALISKLENNILKIERGEGCPEVFDLHKEILRITKIIEERIDGDKEEINKPVISNIQVTNITTNGATISWIGDKRFDKYLVTYFKEGEGLIVKEVTSSKISLKELSENSEYSVKVVGVSAESTSAEISGEFLTLVDSILPPQNIVGTFLENNSVNLIWDNDAKHKSYKLIYTDEDGNSFNVYPNRNILTIPNLDPAKAYSVEVMAVGENGKESDWGTANIGLYCDTKISLVGDNQILEGEYVRAFSSCLGTVTWSDGREGKSIVLSPIVTTTYTATCEVTANTKDNQGNPTEVEKSCTSAPVTIYVGQRNRNIIASYEPAEVKLGNPVMLKVKGCVSDVIWYDAEMKFVSSKTNFIVNPTQKGTKHYKVSCKDGQGNTYWDDLSFEVLFDCQLTTTVSHNRETNDRFHYLNVYGCEKDDLQYSIISGSAKKDRGKSDIDGGGVRIQFDNVTSDLNVSLNCKDECFSEVEVPRVEFYRDKCFFKEPLWGSLLWPAPLFPCNERIDPCTEKNFNLKILNNQPISPPLVIGVNNLDAKIKSWDVSPASEKIEGEEMYEKNTSHTFNVPLPSSVTRTYTIKSEEGCTASIVIPPIKVESDLSDCPEFTIIPNGEVKLKSGSNQLFVYDNCFNGQVEWYKLEDGKKTVIATNQREIIVKGITRGIRIGANCTLQNGKVQNSEAKITITTPPASQIPFSLAPGSFGNISLFSPIPTPIPAINLHLVSFGTSTPNSSNVPTIVTRIREECPGLLSIDGGTLSSDKFTIEVRADNSLTIKVTWDNEKHLRPNYNFSGPSSFLDNNGMTSLYSSRIIDDGSITVSRVDKETNLTCTQTLDIRAMCVLSASLSNKVTLPDGTFRYDQLTVTGCPGGDAFARMNDGSEISTKSPNIDYFEVKEIVCKKNNQELCTLPVARIGVKNSNGFRINGSEEEPTPEADCLKSRVEMASTLLNGIICNDILKVYGQVQTDGSIKIPVEKAREILSMLKAKESTQDFQTLGFTLPEITDQMVQDLADGKCSEVVQSLTSNLSGDLNADDEAVKTAIRNIADNGVDDVLEELENIEDAKIISNYNYRETETFFWLNPTSATNPNAREANSNALQGCVAHYFDMLGRRIAIPGITDCEVSVNGILISFKLNGQTYDHIYYESSKEFLGYYNRAAFNDRDGDGKITIEDLTDEPNFWIKPPAILTEETGYKRLENFLNNNAGYLQNPEMLTEVLELIQKIPEGMFEKVEGATSLFKFRLEEIKAILEDMLDDIDDHKATLQRIVNSDKDDDEKRCEVYAFYKGITNLQERQALHYNLDIETRKKLIKLLAEASLTSGISPVGSCATTSPGEEIVLELIRTTPVHAPDNDVVQLLTFFKTGSPMLLETLISRIDYGDLVNAIVYIQLRDQGATTQYDKLSQNIADVEKYFLTYSTQSVYGYKDVGKTVYDYSWDNDKIRVGTKTVTYTPIPEAEWNPDVPKGHYTLKDGGSFLLDPFDLIVLRNDTYLSAIQEDLGLGAEQSALVPAVTLMYAKQKQLNYNIIQSINLVSVVAGGAGMVNAFRLGYTWLAIYEAAGVVGALGDVVVQAADVPATYRDIVGFYNLCVGTTGLGILGRSAGTSLGAFARDIGTDLTKFKIPRQNAQAFMDTYARLRADNAVWSAITANTRKKLEDLAVYFASKGIRGITNLSDALLYSNLAKYGTLDNLKKLVVITGFSLLSHGDIVDDVVRISKEQPVAIALASGNKLATLDGISEVSKFTSKPVIGGALSEVTELNPGGLSSYGSGAGIENPAAWVNRVAADVEMSVMELAAHTLIILGNTAAGYNIYAREKEPEKVCNICVNESRKTLTNCEPLNALHQRMGGSTTDKALLRTQLCESALSNAELLAVALRLSKVSSSPPASKPGEAVPQKDPLKVFFENLHTAPHATQLYRDMLTEKVADTWEYLYQSKKFNAAKTQVPLEQMPTLRQPVKEEIVQLTDVSLTTSKLIEFNTDLKNTSGFKDFINDTRHFKYAEGFLGYRHDYTPEDYEVLTEELPNLNLSQPLADKIGGWLDHAVDATNRLGYYQKGRDFEDWIKSQLSNSGSNVYKSLKSEFAKDSWNLDEYSIYSQVHFCINGSSSCNGAGTYFIADFVFVKEVIDPVGGNYFDVKIIDTKLSASTDFTENQRNSKKEDKLYIKTVGLPIKGTRIESFQRGNDFKNSKIIYKVYSGGTSSSYGGITK